MLPLRQNLLEIFSCFIEWSDQGKFKRWAIDARLKRNMAPLIEHWPNKVSDEWAIYWHQQWLSTTTAAERKASLSKQHLFAFLQSSCYRAVKRQYDRNPKPDGYELRELFNDVISCLDKLLETYSPKINPNLQAYAYHIVEYRAVDKLRCIDKRAGRSEWSLLLRTSSSLMRKALIHWGLADQNLVEHFWVWECYVTIYEPRKEYSEGIIQTPSESVWQLIFDSAKFKLEHHANLTDIHRFIQNCLTALNHYLSPNVLSLNQKDKKTDQERLGNIVDESPVDDPDEYSWADAYKRIVLWQKTALEDYYQKHRQQSPTTQDIVELKYGKKQKQKDISKQLNINQSNVSRRLNALVAALAREFIFYAEKNLHITVQSTDIELVQALMWQGLNDIYTRQGDYSRGNQP